MDLEIGLNNHINESKTIIKSISPKTKEMNTKHSQSISTLSKEIVQNIENKDGNNKLIPTGFEYLDEEIGRASCRERV